MRYPADARLSVTRRLEEEEEEEEDEEEESSPGKFC